MRAQYFSELITAKSNVQSQAEQSRQRGRSLHGIKDLAEGFLPRLAQGVRAVYGVWVLLRLIRGLIGVERFVKRVLYLRSLSASYRSRVSRDGSLGGLRPADHFRI